MKAQAVIETVVDAGGELTISGDRIRYRLPKDHPEKERILAELREHKPEIIWLLSARPLASSPVCSEAAEGSWPPASLEAERRFGQAHARLFPFISKRVWTPQGPGVLLTAYADRCEIQLDSVGVIVRVEVDNVKVIQ